ncbi:MAG: hypothetical protein OEY89_00840 [Gammaproteobacteria bacterium]|nr:hypothetical protein [Gammaproteobacteria bacterium]
MPVLIDAITLPVEGLIRRVNIVIGEWSGVWYPIDLITDAGNLCQNCHKVSRSFS